MERHFLPTEIGTCRELARVGLVSKHHCHAQMIQFVVLNNQRWQPIIEAKQGRFQLDPYRPFAFKHENMLYNARDHERIPNARDNPWVNCPEKTQNTNILSSTN